MTSCKTSSDNKNCAPSIPKIVKSGLSLLESRYPWRIYNFLAEFTFSGKTGFQSSSFCSRVEPRCDLPQLSMSNLFCTVLTTGNRVSRYVRTLRVAVANQADSELG